MARCGCASASASCNCTFAQGTGITITGAGTLVSPYLIALSSTISTVTILDTPTLNFTITGTGAGGSPYIISAALIQPITLTDPTINGGSITSGTFTNISQLGVGGVAATYVSTAFSTSVKTTINIPIVASATYTFRAAIGQTGTDAMTVALSYPSGSLQAVYPNSNGWSHTGGGFAPSGLVFSQLYLQGLVITGATSGYLGMTFQRNNPAVGSANIIAGTHLFTQRVA